MTNLGERYGDQSVIVESAAGTWVHASRSEDGAHVMGLVLAEAVAQNAGEAAEAARAVDALGSPFVAPLAEVASAPAALVWGPAGSKRLADVVKQKGGLSLDRVIDVARQIGLALVAAEEAGVPHHDLSPRTIAVEDAGDTGMLVRVAGFGASKLVPLYSTARKNDPFHGTPEYMAPEVCGGKGADNRSDIYALGIIMYEMVTVKPPFLSNNINTTIKRQIYEKPLPLHLVKPGVDHISELEKVVLRAVEKDPKKRFQSAADLVAALETLRDEMFPELVFSDPGQVLAYASEQAALPAEARGDFIPAAAEDITSRKHGTLVFSGLGQALDLNEDESASAPAASQQPGKPGTQIFAGLGDLIDEDDEEDDARVSPMPAASSAPVEPESLGSAPTHEPEPEAERTLVSAPAMMEPGPVERTVELVEQEPARHATVVFDPREGLDLRPEAATATPPSSSDEDPDQQDDEQDDAVEGSAGEPEPAPKQTMLFEAVKDVPAPTSTPAEEKPAAPVDAKPTAEEPAADSPNKEGQRHSDMVSWAATQPSRDRAKSEEMEAWFAEASADTGEPEDPYTISEGKRSTRKFMIVMGVVTIVLVVLVAVFLDKNDDQEGRGHKAGGGSGKIEQAGGEPTGKTGAEGGEQVAKPAQPDPDQEQALRVAKMVGEGYQALEAGEALQAKMSFEQALKLEPENPAAKAGFEKASALLAANEAPPVAVDAGTQPEAGDGATGGAGAAEASTEEAAAAKAAEEAAAAKAAEEAAAAKAAEEAAAAKAAEVAAAAKAAEEAAAKKAAEEAAAGGSADEAAAKKAADEAAAAKAAEAAAAKKAADEAAAAKAADAAAAKKAADAAAAAKAADAAAAKKAADEAAAKKAAEAGAAKKATGQDDAAKKAAAEAAAAKAAEKAAAKKAAAEAAAKKAAEDAAAKKAADAAKKANAGDVAKGNPEEEAKKLVKLGIGALKAGNNALALKYFNKAKGLNPGDKYIQKYIEKASQ